MQMMTKQQTVILTMSEERKTSAKDFPITSLARIKRGGARTEGREIWKMDWEDNILSGKKW